MVVVVVQSHFMETMKVAKKGQKRKTMTCFVDGLKSDSCSKLFKQPWKPE